MLLDEAHNGYPLHRHLAIGHLAEAESECLGADPKLARRIRIARIKIDKSLEESREHNLEELLRDVAYMAGDEDVMFQDPVNSKIYDDVQILKEIGSG